MQRAARCIFAGFVMCNLMDINPKELISEIKATFATDCVSKTIAGDCKDIIKGIERGCGAIEKTNVSFRTYTNNMKISKKS